MKWFNELSGVSANNMLNISIPKEKLANNIKNNSVKMAAARELEYIEDIVYHAIFRDVVGRRTIDELHIIEVKLREPKYIKIIAEAFQQAIPYSQIVIFSSGEKYALFESNTQADTAKQFQSSKWVYEEELLIDYSLGLKRQSEPVIDLSNVQSWKYLPERLWDIFCVASDSEYLCLRHLIDILRIRELEFEKKLVRPVISKAIEYGKVEYFDDMPFVTWSDANSLYGAAFPYKNSCSIKDHRFGIDRQFGPLTEGDFASYEETLYLLEEIECSLPYRGYDPDRYSIEDDDPKRYDCYE